MLRFEYKPDKIFSKILRLAFENGVSSIVEYTRSDYKCFYPNASKFLSKGMARKVLIDLKRKNEDSHFWELNNCHYCLIYDLLFDFCSEQSDMVRDTNKPILCVNRWEIYEIDFYAIVGRYFADIDFLFDKDLLLNMHQAGKDQMGCADENFGIVMGMKAHPDELRIDVSEPGKFVPEDPDADMYVQGSRKYPSDLD